MFSSVLSIIAEGEQIQWSTGHLFGRSGCGSKLLRWSGASAAETR